MKVIQKLTIILLIVFTLSACINNTEPSDHYQEGNSFLENYQYSLALEQYKLAINDKPGNPDAYLAAADILMLKGDTDEAKDILVLAIEQAEPLAEIHERLGTIYIKQGDFQKALEYFNSGLEISPNYENLIKLKLDALSLLDLLDERVEYAKTINDDKLSQEMLLVKGIILFEDKELSLQVLDEAKKGDNTAVADSANEAIASITSISADEDTLFNMSQLSFTLLKYDYFEIALPLNNKIIESNEYYETGYLYKGISHLRIGQIQVGIDNIEQSLTLNPNNAEARIFLVEGYLRLGDQEGVENAVNGVKPLLNEGTNTQILELANLLFEYQQYPLVKSIIERTKLNDSTLEINLLWAKNLVELGEYSKALDIEELLRGSYDIYSTRQQAEVDAYIGFAMFNLDSKAEGLEMVKNAQLKDRTYAMAFYFEGYILHQQGDLTAAKEALEKAIDLDIDGNTAAQDLLSQI